MKDTTVRISGRARAALDNHIHRQKKKGLRLSKRGLIEDFAAKLK